MFRKSKNYLKGYTGAFMGETGIAKQSGSTVTYQTIKVTRPNGKVFFIMIENFKYNATDSWSYGNNPSNDATYGRLYTWTAAYNNRNRVYMQIPRYSNTTLQPIPGTTSNRPGNLPTFTEIKDLLETEVIGNLPGNGTTIFDSPSYMYYYDNFVFGIADNPDPVAAYHTLAGWRDNMELAPGNQEFNDLCVRGRFWTNELAVTGRHYPFEVGTEGDSWVGYVNAGHNDKFAFSVRYVFYPIYQ